MFLTQNLSSSLPNSHYQVPKEYIDCRKLLQNKLYGPTGNNDQQLTTKQKNKFTRKFYLDQTIKSFKDMPAPDRYLENYSSIKKFKSLKDLNQKPKLNQVNLGKRPTWIEDIQKYQQKYKPPAVGKYNLLTNSSFSKDKKNQKIQMLLKNGRKFNNLDDIAYVSSQIPGPGSHNPHKSLVKLKVNMTTINGIKKKHTDQAKRLKKSLDSSNISSCSYSPVKDKTFSQISKQLKKDASLMRVSDIVKKKGRSSLVLSPGPGAHDIVNKWAKPAFSRQKIIGKLNIFARTTRSLPALKVYH